MLIAAVVCALALAPAVHAANDDYDDLNGVTLGDTPYSSVMPFVAPMQNFDNLTFDADPEYAASPQAYAGCAAWGWRSAWVRFATAVEGLVFVSVDSSAAPGYDVFYNVYIVPTSVPPGSASMSQLTETACHNSNHGPPNEDYSFGHEIPANQTIYVQVMSVCADSTLVVDICDEMEQDAAPGGPTQLSVRFTPDNTDNDGAPDSLDDCVGTPGPVRGCPDADGDGVGEPADACPGVKGSRADGCRVPDEDGDGYAADAADLRLRDCDDDDPSANPGKPEIRGNDVDENCDGLKAFDADGDNWDDAPGPDCDPGNRRIHPEARDRPETRADENCDGRNARFPRVTSQVSPLYLDIRGRTVGFAQFKVLPARRGDRVRIECEGGGCPYSAKTYTFRRSRSEIVVGKEFLPRILKPGASVTVKILRRGHIGRAVRYTIRSATGKPNIQRRCLPPGKTGPRGAADGLPPIVGRARGARAAGGGGRVRGRPDDASGGGGRRRGPPHSRNRPSTCRFRRSR